MGTFIMRAVVLGGGVSRKLHSMLRGGDMTGRRKLIVLCNTQFWGGSRGRPVGVTGTGLTHMFAGRITGLLREKASFVTQKCESHFVLCLSALVSLSVFSGRVQFGKKVDGDYLS
ncbi:hypothetical protein MTP99_008564 [Tenebrio molitor]|nr:hypothetical protein MTP99_008564 [Tenebrio molitor]